MRIHAVAASLVVWLPLSFAQASPVQFRVLIDADADSATGCATPAMPGVDHVLITVVEERHGGRDVISVARQSCSAGVLEAPVTVDLHQWPANGDPAVVETFVPFDVFGGRLPESMRLGFDVTRAGATVAIATDGDGESLTYPRRGGRRRAVDPSGDARMIVLDGMTNDWLGIDALVANEDHALGAVFIHPASSALFFRFDARLSPSGDVTAGHDSYAVARGSVLSVAAPGVLENDDAAQARPAADPVHGVLDLRTDGSFTYAHDGSTSALDSFEYEALRGLEAPVRATVSIHIESPNVSPVAIPDEYETEEDRTLRVSAPGFLSNDSDSDDPPQTLVARIVSLPEHGVVTTESDGALVYVPAPDYFGTDEFEYEVSDGAGGSATALVSILVNAVNDQPSAIINLSAVVLEDAGPQSISGIVTPLPGTGEDAQTVSFATVEVLGIFGPITFVQAPALSPNGTLSFEAAPNSWGVASVRFSVTDDGGTENGGVDSGSTIDILIIVQAVNDPPTVTLSQTSFTMLEDTELVVPFFLVADRGPLEDDPNLHFWLTAESSTELLYGDYSLTPDGTLELNPFPNSNGTLTLTIHVSDEAGGYITESVTVEVIPVNDPPSAILHPLRTNEDSGAESRDVFAVLEPGTYETQNVTTSVRVLSVSGSLAFATPPVTDGFETLSWNLVPDTSGTATLEFTIRDDGGTDHGGIDTLVITAPFEVTAWNDWPSFTQGEVINLLEDAPPYSGQWATDISAGAADESGQTLHFEVERRGGPLSFTTDPAIDVAGVVTFEIAPESFGWSEFLVRLFDDEHGIGFGVLTVIASPVNDPPTFTMLAEAATDEDNEAVFPGFITSSSVGPNESESVQFQVRVISTTAALQFRTNPLIYSDGTLYFEPFSDSNGTALVEVTAFDGQLASAPQTFTIIVRPVNDPPILDWGQFASEEDEGPITRSLNLIAYPPDEITDALTFSVTQTSGGIAFATPPSVDSSGMLTYESAPNANGSVVYAIVATDPGGLSSSSEQYTIIVRPVNDEPTFDMASEVVIDEDAGPQLVSGFVHNISAGPPDEPQTVSFQINSVGGVGLAMPLPTIDAAGDLSFHVLDNTSGYFIADMLVIDSEHAFAIKRFTITVRPVNDPPSFDVPAQHVVTAAPASASIPNFVLNIMPGPNETGSVTFQLTADDTSIFVSGGEPTVDVGGGLAYQLNGTAGRTTVTIVADDGGGGTTTKTFELVADSIPEVINSTPFDGQANFPGSTDITVTFSEAVTVISPSSLGTGGTFLIDCGSGPLPYALDITSGTSFTLDPDAKLPGGSCTVTVMAGLVVDNDTDDGPDTMGANHAFTFSVTNLPVVSDEAFDAVGNVPLQLPAPGVLANDVDLAGEPLAVVPAVVTGANGGSVTFLSNGSFTYLSAAGAGNPAAAETFAYTVDNGEFTAGGMLTISVSGRYWYVQHDAAPGGNGRSTAPFDTINEAVIAAAENETILILAGGAGGLNENVTPRVGQSLIGQGITAPLTISLNGSPFTLLSPGSTPAWTSSSGTTLSLASNHTVEGLAIASANGDAVTGNTFGTFVIRESSIDAVGGEALGLANGIIDGSLTQLSSTSSASMGVRLQSVSGSLTAVDGSIEGAAVGGVSLSGDVIFDYPGDIVHSGSNRAVRVMDRTSGAVTFTGSVTSTTRGILLAGNSGGSASFTGPVTLDTGTAAGVEGFSNATPFATTFSGGLALTTTTGTAFDYRNGALEVTGSTNEVATGGGLALQVIGARIDDGGLRFESIATPPGVVAVTLSQLSGTGEVSILGGVMGRLLINDSSLVTNLGGISIEGDVGLRIEDFGVANIADVVVEGNGAIYANNGTLNGSFASIQSAGGNSGVTLIDVDGTVAIESGSFAQTGNNQVLEVSGGSVNVTWHAAATYDGSSTFMQVSGGHDGALTFDDGALDSNSGAGLYFSDADGTYAFNGPLAIDGGTRGIDIGSASDGAFRFGDQVAIGASVRPSAYGLIVSSSTPDISFAGSLQSDGDVVYLGGVPHVAGREIVFESGSTVGSDAAGVAGIYALSVDVPVRFLGTTTLTGLARVQITNGGANGVFEFATGTSVTPSAAVTPFAFSGGSDVDFNGSLTQSNAAALVVISSQSASSAVVFSGPLDATAGDGIQITQAAGTVDFTGTTTLHGGDAGIDILNNSTGTFTFGSNTSVVDPTGHAFSVSSSSCNVSYGGSLTMNGGAGAVVSLSNHTGGAIAFNGAITASAGTGIVIASERGTAAFNGATLIDGGGARIELASILAGGNVSFGPATTLVSSAATQPLLVQNSAGTVAYLGSVTQAFNAPIVEIDNVTGGRIDIGGTLTATNGSGIRLSGVSTEVDFAGIVNLGGGDAGIDVVDSFGRVDFGPLVTIGSISGNLVHLTGGTPKMQFESPLSSSAGPLLVIENTSLTSWNPADASLSADIAFTGAMTKSGTTSAIVMQNAGASVDFLGPVNAISDGASPILLDDAHVVRFRGGLDVTSDGAAGFYARATWVEVTGSSNTIETLGATALELRNVLMLPGGVNFASVDADGAAKGIVLDVAPGYGGLVVDGGTIANMTERGVEVYNAYPPTLRNLTFTNVATSAGAPCSAADNTGCNAAVHLRTINGGGTIPSVLSNLTVNGAGQGGIVVYDGDTLRITDTTITNISGAPLLVLQTSRIALTDVEVTDSGTSTIERSGETSIFRTAFGTPANPLAGDALIVSSSYNPVTIDDSSMASAGGLLLNNDLFDRMNVIVRNSVFTGGGIEVVVGGAGSPCSAVDLDANTLSAGAAIDLVQTAGTLKLPGYDGSGIAAWVGARNGGATVNVTGANIIAGAACP